MKNLKILFLLASVTVLLAAFQNCSEFEPTEISSSSGTPSSPGNSVPDMPPVEGPTTPDTPTTPVTPTNPPVVVTPPIVPPTTPTPTNPAVLALTLEDRLSLGTHHSCGIENSQLYCWGRTWEGQVGNNVRGTDKPNQNTPLAIATDMNFKMVSSGTQFSCGLTNAGVVYCWGNNTNGVLGVGDKLPRSVPTQVAELNFYGPIVKIGVGRTFNIYSDHIPAGRRPAHACALTESGKVYCWGDNSLGQLGVHESMAESTAPRNVIHDKAFDQLHVGGAHSCAREKESKKYFCWGSNYVYELASVNLGNIVYRPVELVLPHTVKDLALGVGITCYTTATNNAYCLGRNGHAELGRGTRSNREAGPMPVGQLQGRAAKIYPGSLFACARTTANEAYCWGDNYSGQQGTGSTGGTFLQPAKVNLGTAKVSGMALGTFNTCAILESGEVRCWGHGYFGELGTGMALMNYPTPARVQNFSMTSNVGI